MLKRLWVQLRIKRGMWLINKGDLVLFYFYGDGDLEVFLSLVIVDFYKSVKLSAGRWGCDF